MHTRILLLAIVLAVIACSISLAQERGWASSIEWSPDGQTIAIGGSAGIWLFDNEFNEVGHIPINLDAKYIDSAGFVSWNATGEWLAYSGINLDTVKVVDVGKRKVITDIDASRLQLWTPVVWHPTDNLIVAGAFDGKAYIWDAETGQERFLVDIRAEASGALDSEAIGSCWISYDTVVIVTVELGYVLNIAENRMERKFYIPGWPRWTMPTQCNSRNELMLNSGELVNLETGTSTRVTDTDYYRMALEWSPNSSHFVSSSFGCNLRVFDGGTYQVVQELAGGRYWTSLASEAKMIAWHPDGSRFAVVGEFDDIRVWDAETYELLQRFHGFETSPGVSAALKSLGKTEKDLCP